MIKLKRPDTCIDEDGDLGFEWDLGKDLVLSIYLDHCGIARVAMLDDGEPSIRYEKALAWLKKNVKE